MIRNLIPLATNSYRNLLFVSSVMCLTACAEPDAPVVATPGVQSSVASWQAGNDETLDDEWERMAATTIPGFAGFYIDRDTTVIRLANIQSEGAARRYIAGTRHVDTSVLGAVRIEQAQYDFSKLRKWANKLQQFVGHDDVYALDVDERTNKIWFGVGNLAALDRIRAAAAAAGLPPDVISGDLQGAPTPRIAASTLQDYTDTLRAGFMISNRIGTCTAGFVAKDMYLNPILVSNSHCSNRQYAIDNDTIWQPYFPAIGVEVADRGLYKCEDYMSNCRRSDASYFAYTPGRSVNQGYIQATQTRCRGIRCTIVLNTQYPLIPIVNKSLSNTEFPVSPALVINKVGAASGWTYGAMTRSCVTIGVLACQYVTSTYSETGDSGAPVFEFESDGVSARLIGLLWGGPAGDFKTSYFSGLASIQADLGNIFVCITYSTPPFQPC